MKTLNIDELVTPKRQLTLGGKDYTAKELTVEQFIENLAAVEALENEGKKLTPAESMAAGVKSICQVVPELDEATVRALPVPAMVAILQFLRGEMDEKSKTEASAAEGEQGKA